MRRDWLLTGLSIVAGVTILVAVNRAIDFSANAAQPSVVAYEVDK
jgi:hypothetical protein